MSKLAVHSTHCVSLAFNASNSALATFRVNHKVRRVVFKAITCSLAASAKVMYALRCSLTNDVVGIFQGYDQAPVVCQTSYDFPNTIEVSQVRFDVLDEDFGPAAIDARLFVMVEFWEE